MDKSKEIVIVHKTCVADFPPLLTFITYLFNNGYKIFLIVGFEEAKLEELIKPMCFQYHNLNVKPSKNKFLYWFNVRKEFWKVILKNGYEQKLLWIPAADTTLALGKKLLKYNYVLNLYELFDYQFMYVKLLKKYALKAKLVVCSNNDRANILRVWWRLSETPSVILNKPIDSINGKKLSLPNELDEVFKVIGERKILIYQGLIAPERDLEGICLAMKELDDYVFVIMGRNNSYVEGLKQLSSNIIHIPYVVAPYHLHITSHAYIGVLSYDHSSLNNIYCAPNKLWEFSNFAIPMLGNNIPGLVNTIEMYSMGVCVDFSNVDNIIKAIKDIEYNYDLMAKKSQLFYDGYNYDLELDKIMNKI